VAGVVRMLSFWGHPLAEEAKTRLDWAEDELDLIVADYFAMLAAEQAGIPYVKSQHRARVVAQIGRAHGAVERKHMNISAVLAELGRPTINGYKPLAHYQDALLRVIERRLTKEPQLWVPEAEVQFAEPLLPFLEPPPDLQPPRARPAALERLVRKFDPGERDFRNRELGRAGEELVWRFERQRLQSEDRPDLAAKVRWVAQEDGDGAGYDIHSFDVTGRERLIEVKTTEGHRATPFYLTRNEHSLAEERIDAFRLMRVYSFRRDPRMFELSPPLADSVRLSPHTYQASFS
jgi:hypothetical protein